MVGLLQVGVVGGSHSTVKNASGTLDHAALPVSSSHIKLFVFIVVISLKEINVNTVWIFYLCYLVTEYCHANSGRMFLHCVYCQIQEAVLDYQADEKRTEPNQRSPH